MFISFIPALGETTEIAVPSAAFLPFQATLRAPLGQGVRLQLWSNIPIIGIPHGEWGPLDFIASGDSENKLILRAPVFSTSTQVYNFTYRLVHASGEIEWLGEYGQNGSLILQKGSDSLDLTGDWIYSEEDLEGNILLNEVKADIPVARVPKSWNVLPLSSSHLALVPPLVDLAITRTLLLSASNSGHLEYHEDSRVIVPMAHCSLRLSCLTEEHPTAKDIQLVSRDQSSCFMRGSLGKLIVVPLHREVGDAGSLKLDIPWLVQHTIIRGSPQEVLIWSAELPSAEYLGPSRPVLDLPVLPAGGILTVYTSWTLAGSRIFLPANAQIASQDATKNPLPTPPPSPRMKSPVLQSLASTSMAASRSNALVVRQQGTSWLFRLLGQLFRLMLSILVWILKRRRRTVQNSKTNLAPQSTPVTSPDSSQKQVVLAQMLEPTFSVLVSSQSSTNLKVLTTNKMAVGPVQSHLLEVVGLGDVDVLTYDIGGVGLIRISC